MNDSILGIVITFLVLGLVLSIGVTAQGGTGIELPQIIAGTDTSRDGFYDYCYRMGFDC